MRWLRALPVEIVADRAADKLFRAIVRYGDAARERSIAAAQAAIARLMLKQIRRLDPDGARELCHALASEVDGAQIEERFLALKARLTRKEHEMRG